MTGGVGGVPPALFFFPLSNGWRGGQGVRYRWAGLSCHLARPAAQLASLRLVPIEQPAYLAQC